MTTEPRIIIALDFPSAEPALALLQGLPPGACRVKIGKEMFTRLGPDFVRAVIDRGFDVFLDLKYHDIPNTVAAACRAAADLGVWMLNVHASGGRRMMAAARAALAERDNPPLLIGVTMLTSLAEADIAEIGYGGSPEQNVLRLARLGQEAGLDGVVCSPLESAAVRAALGDGFLLVTPGVRPGGSSEDDQQRIKTPADAIRSGSDYLVIGRPITGAADPAAALAAIQAEVQGALVAMKP
ncbi:MAG: orotidine-5'-phosphate decarboxylase [Gammaproteobacteria bacterium SHHR-1]